MTIVMRGSDILRSADHEPKKWNPECDKYVDLILWEQISPETNEDCAMKMRWMLKPTKTGQEWIKCFEKTSLLDPKPGALCGDGFIKHMLELCDEVRTKRNVYTLFMDAQTGHEICLTN